MQRKVKSFLVKLDQNLALHWLLFLVKNFPVPESLLGKIFLKQGKAFKEPKNLQKNKRTKNNKMERYTPKRWPSIEFFSFKNCAHARYLICKNALEMEENLQLVSMLQKV